MDLELPTLPPIIKVLILATVLTLVCLAILLYYVDLPVDPVHRTTKHGNSPSSSPADDDTGFLACGDECDGNASAVASTGIEHGGDRSPLLRRTPRLYASKKNIKGLKIQTKGLRNHFADALGIELVRLKSARDEEEGPMSGGSRDGGLFEGLLDTAAEATVSCAQTSGTATDSGAEDGLLGSVKRGVDGMLNKAAEAFDLEVGRGAEEGLLMPVSCDITCPAHV